MHVGLGGGGGWEGQGSKGSISQLFVEIHVPCLLLVHCVSLIKSKTPSGWFINASRFKSMLQASHWFLNEKKLGIHRVSL